MPSLIVNQQTLADLQTMEEGTLFRVVREYFEDGSTPIDQIGIVQPGWDLCEVAAVLVNPHATEADIVNLLQSGALKYAVPWLKETYDPPWAREHILLIKEIRDSQRCDVIYIPPLYLVKLRNNNG